MMSVQWKDDKGMMKKSEERRGDEQKSGVLDTYKMIAELVSFHYLQVKRVIKAVKMEVKLLIPHWNIKVRLVFIQLARL